MRFEALAIEGLPEVAAGDDLAGLIAERVAPVSGDVLVLAHKVVSKAEGRVRRLADVSPTPRAAELAAQHGKDPRHVQVVLDESVSVLRAARGVLICETRHGFVCANAGVDASNARRGAADEVILLPVDPDASARHLRARLRSLTGVGPGVLITDSFGRAWRHGQVDVAVGCAGIIPLDDWRGRTDASGRELHATWIAIADELAAAADLTRTKDGAQPVVLLHGEAVARHVSEADGAGAAAIRRPKDEDLFR
jgi:coenzyme F420-0:L-glutamate ligase/coenzyme F420-1:gamma-L-glutamate ligase